MDQSAEILFFSLFTRCLGPYLSLLFSWAAGSIFTPVIYTDTQIECFLKKLLYVIRKEFSEVAFIFRNT